eukprot:TRINITY_DN9516_c0_g1_i1.p1 TRINITY_DN9516_c0_g1~~TRINITY_DN9516_c0_g1_i1.p1  ORF type:complete len:326 (+),score=96.68 TRINITY_DN9516_c0_g1_i1:49-1026(+)
MSSKVHTSALCLIPPKHIWDQIQAIRKIHDKSYVRWYPHVNLLYPFFTYDKFEDAKQTAIDALSEIEPFEVTFKEFGYFQHGKRSSTVFLWPQSNNEDKNMTLINNDEEVTISAEVREVQRRLEEAFPVCNDLSTRSDQGFIPHLSVGQFKSRQHTLDMMDQFQGNFESISFTVKELYIISRIGKAEPFKVRSVIPLGSSTPSYVEPTPEIAPLSEEEEKGVSGDDNNNNNSNNIKNKYPNRGDGINLFVSNLSFKLKQEQFEKYFENIKEITIYSIALIMDRNRLRCKGFGFVEVRNEDEARFLIKNHNGKYLQNRGLNIKKAK